jgi:hypothetical protein
MEHVSGSNEESPAGEEVNKKFLHRFQVNRPFFFH